MAEQCSITERFTNRYGTTSAIVCSCGFAVTVSNCGNLEKDEMAFFAIRHEAHKHRIAEHEKQLAAVTAERDALAKLCNLNQQGVDAVMATIAETRKKDAEIEQLKAERDRMRVALKLAEAALDIGREQVNAVCEYNQAVNHGIPSRLDIEDRNQIDAALACARAALSGEKEESRG